MTAISSTPSTFSDALKITYGNQNSSIFISVILLGFYLKNIALYSNNHFCTRYAEFIFMIDKEK